MTSPIIYDTKTHKITIDSALAPPLDSLSKELTEDVDAINCLVADLTTLGEDIPPVSHACTARITENYKKMLDKAISHFKKAEYTETARLASMALEIASRRARWESFGFTLSEVGQAMSLRCDANIAGEKWADAFADASLLALVIPTSPLNFYRKGKCYQAINKLSDAQQCYQTGLTIGSDNAVLLAALSEVNELLAV